MLVTTERCGCTILAGRPMAQPHRGDVTRLLQSWSDGDKRALGELIPLVYPELRRLAAAHLRHERRDHTLQPTALVHEAYLRLVDQTQVQSPSRAQFFGIAAKLMRQILVNHAKYHLASKRDIRKKVAIDEGAAVVQQRQEDFKGEEEFMEDCIALDKALKKLAQIDSRQSRLLELRFFAGLSVEETAEVMGVGRATFFRELRSAKAWLHRELATDRPE